MNEHLDWDKSLVLCGNKIELTKELLELFIVDISQSKKLFAHALAEKNYTKIADQAHKLLGGCSYIVTPKLQKFLQQIETDTKNQNHTLLGASLQRVYDEIEIIINCSQQLLDIKNGV